MFETVGYRFAPPARRQGLCGLVPGGGGGARLPGAFRGPGRAGDRADATWLKSRDPLFSAEHSRHHGPCSTATRGEIQRRSRSTRRKSSGKVMATGPDQFAILFRPAPPAARGGAGELHRQPGDADQGACRTPSAGWPSALPYTRRASASCSTPPCGRSTKRAGGSAWPFPRSPRNPPRTFRAGCDGRGGRGRQLTTWARCASRAPPASSREELLKTANFKTGDLANFDARRSRASSASGTLLRHNGYLQRAGGCRAQDRRCHEDRGPHGAHRRRPPVHLRQAGDRGARPARRSGHPPHVGPQARQALQRRLPRPSS